MLLSLLWLAVPAYLVVQAVVLWRSSGRARLAAGAPLIVMVPVFAMSIAGLILNKNLWPLFLLFASPLALLYVCIAVFVIPRSTPHRSAGTNPGPGTPVVDV